MVDIFPICFSPLDQQLLHVLEEVEEVKDGKVLQLVGYQVENPTNRWEVKCLSIQKYFIGALSHQMWRLIIIEKEV